MGLDGRQIQTFNEKGFIVVKNFFAGHTVERLSDWLDEIRDKLPGEGREARYYEISPLNGENLLTRVEYVLGDHNPDITKLLLSEEAVECLADLLGEDPVLFKEKVNYKLPGCRPDKLHQDQAAGWSAYSDFFITMAVVVDANRKDNAALTFMQSGNYERKLMTGEWQPLSTEDPPYQPENEYLLLEADPGDVVFFDCYVPHGSPANNSNRSRRNIFLTFNRQSDGDMRDRYYADKWANYPPNDSNSARPDESYRV